MATKAGYYDIEGSLIHNVPSINVHDWDLPYPIGFLHVYEIEGLKGPEGDIEEPKISLTEAHGKVKPSPPVTSCRPNGSCPGIHKTPWWDWL